jgi:hypothetical protein
MSGYVTMLFPLSAERAGVRGPTLGTPFPLPPRRIYPFSSSQSNALSRGSRVLRFTFHPSCSRFTWKVVFQKWVVLENHNGHRRPLAADEAAIKSYNEEHGTAVYAECEEEIRHEA